MNKAINGSNKGHQITCWQLSFSINSLKKKNPAQDKSKSKKPIKIRAVFDFIFLLITNSHLSNQQTNLTLKKPTKANFQLQAIHNTIANSASNQNEQLKHGL